MLNAEGLSITRLEVGIWETEIRRVGPVATSCIWEAFIFVLAQPLSGYLRLQLKGCRAVLFRPLRGQQYSPVLPQGSTFFVEASTSFAAMREKIGTPLQKIAVPRHLLSRHHLLQRRAKG